MDEIAVAEAYRDRLAEHLRKCEAHYAYTGSAKDQETCAKVRKMLADQEFLIVTLYRIHNLTKAGYFDEDGI